MSNMVEVTAVLAISTCNHFAVHHPLLTPKQIVNFFLTGGINTQQNIIKKAKSGFHRYEDTQHIYFI